MSASPNIVLTEAEITEREQRQIDRASSSGKTPVVFLHALIDGAQLKVYPGAPHGITDTHKEQLGADLLEFLNATNERAADESCHVHA